MLLFQNDPPFPPNRPSVRRASPNEIVGTTVEASNVTNIDVEASGWDLRSAADGGCGVAGCDPRLTRVNGFAPLLEVPTIRF